MFYGWRVVAGSFTTQLFVVGFFSYAVSLLVEPVRAEFGVSLEQVMYSLTASTLLGLFLQPVGGILVDRYSVRVLMAAGALLYAAGLLALSRANGIGQYILFFALTMSLSNALAGPVASTAVVSRWFTASRGRALGLAALGTSVGGVLIPALITHWIDTESWRGALENLAYLIIVVLVPVILLLVRSHPADIGLEAEPAGDGAAATAAEQPNIREILRNPSFWYIGLSLGVLFSVYSAVLSNITPYAINTGSSMEQASTLIMSIAIAGFIGKILFGIAADKISLRTALWLAQALVVIAFLILAQSPGHGLMLVGTSILGLAAGGMLPVWAALMAHVFGLASYGKAMGLMGPVITLCVMPSYTVIGRMVDSYGSYTPSLYLFTGFCFVAAALLLPLRLEKPS